MQKKYQKIVIKTIYTLASSKTAFTLDDCAKKLMETCEIKKKRLISVSFSFICCCMFLKDFKVTEITKQIFL